MEYENYTDVEFVNGILSGDDKLIEYFFQKKCSKLLSFILYNVFDGHQDKRELLNELFLYMSDNDWNKLRQFEYRSSLMTYISVIAVRFFQKKRQELIDYSGTESLCEKHYHKSSYVSSALDRRLDIKQALDRMSNERYRKVIIALDLHDMQPDILASQMNVTVDNLYNIHRRALLQLRLIMSTKEDYV